MSVMLKSILLSGLALSAIAPAAAQTPPEQTADAPTADTIIVTGTRRLDRTMAESPVPIDVLGGDALAEQGFTETNRILNQLVPSFNFPQPAITDGTDVIRPATLRGLGPDQTLVLVNGKRRHPTALLNINGSVGRGTAAVDLNMIPALAIERIEVLRDGASSQYGSDAIAGVINVRLKSAREGGTVTATYGKYITTLDGVEEISGITRDAAGNPVFAGDGTFQLESTGRNRRAQDGGTLTLAANIGLPVGADGFINVTAEMRDRNATNRSGYDPRRQYAQSGAVDPREYDADRLNHRYGDAETRDYGFFVNSGLELSDSAELYLFGNYGVRDGESAGYFRRSHDARNRNYSKSVPPAAFVPFHPDGFLPFIVTDLEDWSVAAGVRGTAASWNWDLSYVHGRNAFDFSVENSFNTSFGDASQTEFDAGGLRFAHHLVNLDLQREFDLGIFADTVSVAFGAEYRDETFKIRAGEPQSYAGGPFTSVGAPAGAQVFPGFRPENAGSNSRHSWAAYVELDTDIAKNWSLQVAGRFEDYSDFGSTLNGKIATRLSVLEDVLAIRGSASTGFRAPSLHQQHYATTSTNNIAGTLVEIGTFPVESPVARALGSKPLEPEESVNLSAGVTLTPFDRFSLTIDYYRITIDDRIVVTENLQGAQVEGLLKAAGFNNITSARFFINGIDTRTQGIDMIATYRWETEGAGDFSFTAGYNRNKTKITGERNLPTLPGLDLFSRVESLRIEKGQPRSKLNLGVDWELNRVSATLRTNRYGKVYAPAPNPLEDVEIAPEWVTDVELRFKAMDSVELAVGANNVFDVYPTRLPTGRRPDGQYYGVNNYFTPYSVFSPFGFNGRFLYARATVNF